MTFSLTYTICLCSHYSNYDIINATIIISHLTLVITEYTFIFYVFTSIILFVAVKVGHYRHNYYDRSVVYW